MHSGLIHYMRIDHCRLYIPVSLKLLHRSDVRSGFQQMSCKTVPVILHTYNRHTINTIVRNSGHDPAKIRAVLDWMDEEIQDNYTHWEAEHLRKWAEIVDKIWG